MNTTTDSSQPSYLTYEDVVEEQSDKAEEYHRITLRLDIASRIYSIAFAILITVLLIPNALRDISPFGTSYSLPTVGFVFIILYLTSFIVSLPLSYYTEQVEHRYGFATRSRGEWVKDTLKELVLSLVILTVLIEALFVALNYQPRFWYLYAFGGYFIFAGILSSLSPFLISLFTRIESLPEGEVRETVENLAKEMGLEYKDIYRWNMSDQTTKANAAVTGFGNTIRIMLGDTLIDHFRTDEIEIVMAHEIAHQQNRDVYRSIFFTGIVSLVAFLIIELGFASAIDLFALNSKSDPAAIGYIWAAMIVVMQFLNLATLAFSRSREKIADLAAIDQIRDLEVFVSAFARFSRQNLSYPNPSTLEVLLRYSHPPIRDRIAYARQYLNSQEL